ncbi:hypothetical protein D3C76_1800690 [compost metagenome]
MDFVKSLELRIRGSFSLGFYIHLNNLSPRQGPTVAEGYRDLNALLRNLIRIHCWRSKCEFSEG